MTLTNSHHLLSLGDMTKFLTELPMGVKVTMVFTILPIYIFKDSIGTVIKKIPISSLRFFKKKDPIVVEKEVIKYITKEFDYSELLFHDFFLSLKQIDSKIKQIDFSNEKPLNPIKRTMMLKLMEYKMISIEEGFKKIIKQNDLESITAQEFKFRVISTITELIEDYNKKAVEKYISMGVSLEDSWYFVDSYEGYRSTVIESFVERLESICVSKQYSSNYERLLAMFEILTVAVDIIPRDVKSLYFIINGRYDKYTNITTEKYEYKDIPKRQRIST